MAAIETPAAGAARTVAAEAVGRVATMTGSEATVDLSGRVTGTNSATVGKFLAVTTARSVVVGLITEIGEQAISGGFRKIAEVDLIGEIRNDDGSARFRRGVSDYPSIGDSAAILSDAELKMIYGSAQGDRVEIGHLQQNPDVRVHIDIEQLVSKHFAIVGTTGVGKSNGVASILQRILDTRSTLRIFLIDPHNEYGRCFGDKAQVLNPRNLKLPFWLFNFEEIVDAFFGGRPGVPEEMEILSETIALAKGAYLQYRGNNNDSLIAKKREARSTAFTADTPVPYRIEDLITIIDEQMGKLENRASRMVYHKLMTRVQTIRNHPRYAFMFENANIGGDTMAETICQLFRLPPQDKPMTVMQLAGFPAEVVELGGLGAQPHGVRLRPVERRRFAAVVRLRGSAPLRARRQQDRLRADPAGAVAHRQGGSQVRRIPRADHAAACRDRSEHHLAMLDPVCDAAVERSRPGADPLCCVRCRVEPAVVHSLARHAGSLCARAWRRPAHPHDIRRTAEGEAAEQRLCKYPLRRWWRHHPGPDPDGD